MERHEFKRKVQNFMMGDQCKTVLYRHYSWNTLRQIRWLSYLTQINNQSPLSVSWHRKICGIKRQSDYTSRQSFWLRSDNFSHLQQCFDRQRKHQFPLFLDFLSVNKPRSPLKGVKDILGAWVPSSFKRSFFSISTFVSFNLFFRLALAHSTRSWSAVLLSFFFPFECRRFSVGTQSTLNLSVFCWLTWDKMTATNTVIFSGFAPSSQLCL